jgi:hypothetical protein
MQTVTAHVRRVILETLADPKAGGRSNDEHLRVVLMFRGVRGVLIDRQFIAEEAAWLQHFGLVTVVACDPCALLTLTLTERDFAAAHGFFEVEGVARSAPPPTTSQFQ